MPHYSLLIKGAPPIILIGTMTERQPPRPKVIPFAESARECMALVRKLAQKTENVMLSRHAKERMELRGFTNMEVIQALRIGDCHDNPVPGDNPGEVKVKVVRQVPGGRTMGVITLIVKNETRLLVKTVEWEDA